MMASEGAPSYQVVTHVPHALLARFEASVGTQHVIIHATNWDDLVVAVQQRHVDLVVADTAVDGALGVERIEWLLATFPSVAGFAREVGVSRRHLSTLFRTAGMGPPARVLVGAQLARACTYLRDPGATVAVVAAKVQWTDPPALERSLERAFGMSMTHLRRYQPAEQLVQRLVDWIQAA